MVLGCSLVQAYTHREGSVAEHCDSADYSWCNRVPIRCLVDPLPMSNNEDKEAYDRWQAFRINQLGVCIALFLSFAVATLGFSLNLLVEHTNIIGECLAKPFFLFSILFGLLSFICGSATCLTRLTDFRKTAQIARHRSDSAMASIVERWRDESDKLGDWTWGLFWCQLMSFGLQAFLLTLSLGITYWPRLFHSSSSLDVTLAGVATPQVSPEWVLVIVGSLTFIVIGWQAYETRRAADASRLAATAARDSADALIASERAWVVAELIPVALRFSDKNWYRSVGTMKAVLSDEEILSGEHLRHKLKLTNMGRTPASIIGFQIEYSCLPDAVKELPQGHTGQQVSFFPFEHFLAGGESIEIAEPTVDVNAYLGSSVKAIKELKETAVFHGWVQYQHIFNAKDVIKEPFCYCYSPQSLRLNRAPKPKTAN